MSPINRNRFRVWVLLGASAMCRPVAASFVLFDDFTAWSASAGASTTIGFTGFADGTIITNQYEPLGVVFAEGDDAVQCCGFVTYPLDGAGLYGNTETITMLFETPQAWLGVSYPGGLQIDLYSGNTLVYTSAHHLCCGNGYGFFGGVVGTQAFDRAVLSDWIDDYVFIDSVFFGGAVPAPAAIVPIACFMMVGCRRRR